MPDDLTLPEVPAGVPSTFQEHLKLLMDLQVIAFQAEITRVSTLMFARELSGAVFPETNIRDPFHNLSHHSNDRANMDRFALLNTYHMTEVRVFRREAEEHARRRRHAARSLGRALRQLAQRRQPAQLQPAADRAGRRRIGSAEGRTPPAVPEGHAHVEPAARACSTRSACESRSSATAPACWRLRTPSHNSRLRRDIGALEASLLGPAGAGPLTPRSSRHAGKRSDDYPRPRDARVGRAPAHPQPR